MSRLLVPACSVLFLGSCWAAAADTPAPQPIGEFALADGAQLVAHWNASIYFKAWNDPAAAPLREKFNTALDATTKEIGFNPLELLAAVKQASLRFNGMAKPLKVDGVKATKTPTGETLPLADKPQPLITMQADLGKFAALVMTQAKKDGKTTAVPGADEAAISGKGDKSGLVARFGSVIVASTDKLAKLALMKSSLIGKDDAAVHVDGKSALAMVDAIEGLNEDQKAKISQAMVAVKSYLGDMDYRMRIVPEGIWEQFHVGTLKPMPGYRAVDRDLLTRLPATTLFVIASGVDYKAAWAADRETQLRSLGANLDAADSKTKTPDEIEAEINTALQGFGFTSTIADFYQGTVGTVMFAMSQGSPFPAFTFSVPRSKAMDEAVALGLKQLSADVPAEGTSAVLPIPNMPIMATLVCEKDHWLITTDNGIAGSWLTGTPGGWADTKAAKLALEKAPAGAAQSDVRLPGHVLRYGEKPDSERQAGDPAIVDAPERPGQHRLCIWRRRCEGLHL